MVSSRAMLRYVSLFALGRHFQVVKKGPIMPAWSQYLTPERSGKLVRQKAIVYIQNIDFKEKITVRIDGIKMMLMLGSELGHRALCQKIGKQHRH